MVLAGKTAIITGGSSGIGREIALRFAREGASVAIAGRDLSKAEAVVAEITAAGGTARAYACDVAKKADVDALVEAVTTDFGGLDILIANAGFWLKKPIEELTEEDWDKTIGINLKGSFFSAQAVIPAMRAQGGGKIVLLGSTAGMIAYPNGGVYCTSKAGVIMLTKVLAAELARHGINVNCLSPGGTATPLNAEVRQDPAAHEKLAGMTPTGKGFIDPADMAGTALFLASDAANAVHGVNIAVDDGFTAVKPV